MFLGFGYGFSAIGVSDSADLRALIPELTVVGVVIRVVVVCGADVVHVVDGAALHAAGLGLIAGESDPEDVVRIRGKTSATDVLLVTGRVDVDGVLHRAYGPSAIMP